MKGIDIVSRILPDSLGERPRQPNSSDKKEVDSACLDPGLSLQVCRDIASYLRVSPLPVGKPRIKKLSGYTPPLYRLRSGDFRAYYRIKEGEVVVPAVRQKKDSDKFFRRIRK